MSVSSTRSVRAGRLGLVAIPGIDLAEILMYAGRERQVGNDNCVSFNRLKLQIPESPLRPHFVKVNVKVRQYPDGRLAIFHGPRCIGRYDKKGALEEENKPYPTGRLTCRQCDHAPSCRGRQKTDNSCATEIGQLN